MSDHPLDVEAREETKQSVQDQLDDVERQLCVVFDIPLARLRESMLNALQSNALVETALVARWFMLYDTAMDYRLV